MCGPRLGMSKKKNERGTRSKCPWKHYVKKGAQKAPVKLYAFYNLENQIGYRLFDSFTDYIGWKQGNIQAKH